MKTNLFFGLALLSMAPNAVSAQENSDSLYIRNSVYMLKLDMPADNEEYAHAYEVTNKAFDGIDFATRYPNYNDFNLGSHHIDWSTVPTAQRQRWTLSRKSRLRTHSSRPRSLQWA